MKIFKWMSDNLLFVFTLILLGLIPLYPKIPLIDIKNTWVYVRAEDFFVTFVVLFWVGLVLFRRVTLKTPLTLPIFIFWIIGGISTLHGVLLIFPTISDVFSNVAMLSLLRRVEYLSLFFVAVTSIKDKKAIFYVVWALAIVLLLVAGYGFGQKFLSFPAYLTMNEEFAKGIPIHLSELSRVPSTFAGHYDLAAYLVLVIPILISIVFGFRNLFAKLFFLTTSVLGFILLFMTVSRVSFFVLLISIVVLLILQKKKWFIGSLLVVAVLFLSFAPSLIARFGDTVKEINVLVDARTGGAIGQVKEVPSAYFKDKIIKKVAISNKDALNASVSAVVPFSLIPPIASLVVEANSPTGENLPQGTSYINLPLSPVIKKVDEYYYQKLTNKSGLESEEISVIYGDFLIKKAKAYDLSFTTRFQGEWPNAILAFKRNIFLGSGYGSVSLAVDNNYLRILGESGLLGFVSFISIFLIAGIYIWKILPNVTSPVVRNFVFGFVAGAFGLALNALLIDVFEASKVAFTLWLLMGITLGILSLYKTEDVDILKELKRMVTSTVAVVVYLFVASVLLLGVSSYFFVGDDFTWFKWVTDPSNSIISYFTKADGFFYRPGTKLYFYLMHSVFWLNQSVYHFVSIFLHFAVSVLVFLIAKRIFKNYFSSVAAAFLFLILSGYHEAVFWISASGFLFNALFAMLSLLSYIYWREKRKSVYFASAIVFIFLSMMFHELGVVVPFLLIAYDLIFGEFTIGKFFKKSYLVLLSPILPYLAFRLSANSHWFSGDYSYSLINFPFNFIGNIMGYLALGFFGPKSMVFYQALRDFGRNNTSISILVYLVIVFGVFILYRLFAKKIEKQEWRIIVFASLFFVISLLPFLGLGNMTSRYSYLSSFGIVILLVFFFKKIYFYLTSISDRYVGATAMTMIVIVYCIFQLFGLQNIHTDWKVAGEKSKRFFISIEEYSKDFWIRDSMQFYFVDIPIRNGEAWVWPVGLEDALWFTFKNPNIAVYKMSDISLAFDQAANSSSAHVFRFDKYGNVEEVVRAKNGQINLLNSPR
ncbi:MAG: O-antigen ligase family protein [Candidatus Levybacteria bacterium]|nr:O-antigen ligase family protein [Candidatus Levybacteria bacterium]